MRERRLGTDSWLDAGGVSVGAVFLGEYRLVLLLVLTERWDTKIDVLVARMDMRTDTLARQLSGPDTNTETLHRDH